MPSPTSPPPASLLRRIGPRGLEGLFGWTFFDPANLVCVSLLGAATALTVWALRERGDPDWYMPLGLYTCLAVFLRGYFFNYYNGRWLGRALVTVTLVGALVVSAALWEDRAQPHEVLRKDGPVRLAASGGLHLAALLHLASAVTLLVHFVLPRRWLIRFTDELADRGGRDAAPDAPIETVDDPAERARRAAAARATEPHVEEELVQARRVAGDTLPPGHQGGGGGA